MGHRMGAGMDIILLTKRLKTLADVSFSGVRHIKVLHYFASKRDNDSCFCFVGFKVIVKDLNYSEAQIRRSARYLERKGLTEYGKGLFHDDGTVAGSGYAATVIGSAVSRLLEDDNGNH